MKLFFIIFFLSLLFGTVVSVPMAPGVTVYMHDIVLISLFLMTRSRYILKFNSSIFIFIGVACLSLLINSSRFAPWQIGQASLYLVRWVFYAGLYGSIIQFSSPSFLLMGLFWTGTAFSTLGLFQYLLYPDLRNLWYLGWDPHYFRLFSSFLDPNYAGLFILLTILLGFSLKKKLWFAQIINILALFLTYSRGSYLACTVGIVVWIILHKQWKWFLALGLFALLLFLPRLGGDTLKLTRMDSTVSRIENWQVASRLFMTSPILGHGFNTLRFVGRASETVITSHAGAGVDNSYLFLLATSGVVGLASYLWFLWSMRTLSPLYWSAMAATLVHAIFINSLFYPWILLWWWIIFGTLHSVRRK